MKNKKLIYHRIRVNQEFLEKVKNSNSSSSGAVNRVAPSPESERTLKKGFEQDTLPLGKCVGVMFIPYFNESSEYNFSGYVSISIQDSFGRNLTAETDFRDYFRRPVTADYLAGYKKVNFETQNKPVKIFWDMLVVGRPFPFIGEFIFLIEQEEEKKCAC